MTPSILAEATSYRPDGVKIAGPRHYQYELMQKAKKENIIAFLETGSGKTFIAVLLIKELAKPRALAYSQQMEAATSAGTDSVVDNEGFVSDPAKAGADIKAQMHADASSAAALAVANIQMHRRRRGLALPRIEHHAKFGTGHAGTFCNKTRAKWILWVGTPNYLH